MQHKKVEVNTIKEVGDRTERVSEMFDILRIFFLKKTMHKSLFK